MIKLFKEFLADPKATDMYITGRAGTGKTTKLDELLDGLENYIVCAFTHKACGILRDKLRQGAKVCTLHSFLKKRPTINGNARNLKHVDNSQVMGESEKVKILFIDEYSMIGEKDLMDIRMLDDLKVVWLGDPHQLPPVGDSFTLKPGGKYSITLTHVYRTAGDNPLRTTLDELVSFIEGAPVHALTESANFKRGQNIVAQDHSGDSVILAFTNNRVQQLNATVQGQTSPVHGDEVFSPTTKQLYSFEFSLSPGEVEKIDVRGAELMLGTKYKTLEHLRTMGIDFACCSDEEGGHYILAHVFGHQDYLDRLKHYKQIAVQANKDTGSDEPAKWAAQNHGHPLAKARAKAWRDFLTFNDCVVCLDFGHAMTVHKSQGSTFDTVYLDTQDIGIAADMDYTLYLKLMYVGTSRASNKVVTN